MKMNFETKKKGYHVFYELLAGADPETLADLDLCPETRYRMLAPGRPYLPQEGENASHKGSFSNKNRKEADAKNYQSTRKVKSRFFS